MASQLVGVSGNRRLTPSEIAKLRARQAYLPQILQAEQARKQMRKESQFRKAQLTQEKKQAKAGLQFQREESAKGMGLEAAKLGTTIMSADFGTNMGTPKLASQMRPTAGEIGAGAKPPATQGIYSNMGNLNVGGGIQGAVGGAGLGFGSTEPRRCFSHTKSGT